MGRNKHNALAATAGRSVKDRHQRAARDNITVPRHLVALPEKNIQSKHKSYFQIFENADAKDKKLDFKVTTNLEPPPGYEFLPSGNPELTNTCKDLSREQGAMVFFVSDVDTSHKNGEEDGKKLALQVHRIGHHFRRVILEQAKNLIGKEVDFAEADNWQLPETQAEIHAQAEAAMRDLFPRIPNFDKHQILEHGFRKGHGMYGKTRVGTSNLPLYRRVQLAVLAHIRHVHTRYDQLLKETEWKVARKTVERQSLDILVKWRGDEETGRDEIGDILREVVVISDEEGGEAADSDDPEDSEDSDADESSDDDPAEDLGARSGRGLPEPTKIDAIPNGLQHPKKRMRKSKTRRDRFLKPQGAANLRKKTSSKKDKRGFNRYEAAQATRAQRWEEALIRSRRAQIPEDPLHTHLQRPSMQSVPRSPSVEITSVHTADSLRYDHTRPASQPLRDPRQWNGQFSRPIEGPAIDSNRQEQYDPRDPRAPHPGSGFGHSDGVFSSRHIGPAPSHPENGQAQRQPHDRDLKDFLVPSIETMSPHSRLDGPRHAQPGFWEQPMSPEQVPAGLPRQYMPMQNRPVGVAPVSNVTMNQALRPSVVAASRERIVPSYEPRYERDPRTQSIVIPQGGQWEYYVREPIYDVHRSGPSVNGSTPLVRVHREARPLAMQAPGPHRMRELSSNRLENHGCATPTAAYEAEPRRRVTYTEASASGFDARPRDPLPGPARPHPYHEVQPAPQGPSWVSNARPQHASAFQPQTQRIVHSGYAQRPEYEETALNYRSRAEFRHGGHVHRESLPSNISMQSTAPGNSGRDQYVYEQPVPPLGVIYTL